MLFRSPAPAPAPASTQLALDARGAGGKAGRGGGRTTTPYARPFQGRAAQYDPCALEHGIGLNKDAELHQSREQVRELKAQTQELMKALQSQLGMDAAKKALAEAKSAVDLERYMESSIAGGNQFVANDAPAQMGLLGVNDAAERSATDELPTYEDSKKRKAGKAGWHPSTGGVPPTLAASNAFFFFQQAMRSVLASTSSDPERKAALVRKYKIEGELKMTTGKPKEPRAKDAPAPPPSTGMEIISAEWQEIKDKEAAAPFHELAKQDHESKKAAYAEYRDLPNEAAKIAFVEQRLAAKKAKTA